VVFALVFHVGQLIVTLAVGLIAFWSQRLSLSELRPVEEQAEHEAEEALQEPDIVVDQPEYGTGAPLRDVAGRPVK